MEDTHRSRIVRVINGKNFTRVLTAEAFQRMLETSRGYLKPSLIGAYSIDIRQRGILGLT